jgi:Predicted membrane protein (DUF2079)
VKRAAEIVPAAGPAVPGSDSARRRWIEDLPALVVIAVTSLYHLWILRGQYHGYVFAFHDLGIISDWFTNAIYHGRPFWITDMAVSHMSVHFTPTVIVLTPFFLFTQSQYVLCVPGVLAIAAGLYIGHRLLIRLLTQRGAAPALATTVSTIVILFMSLNPYVKTVIQSVHIEPLYIPLALAFFYLMLFTERFWLAAILAVLALGVREDAGIYLSMQCLALVFVPRALFANRRTAVRLALGLAVVSMAYVVLVVKVINPLVFGVFENHVQRGWGQWGKTWGEVVWHEATSPLRLARALGNSALLSINVWFLLTPWLVQPLFGLLVNVPGALLYTAEPIDKRMLWFYNASFLLPGFLLAFYLAVDRVAKLWPRVTARLPGLRQLALRWQIAGVLLAGALLMVAPLQDLGNTVEGTGRYERRFQPTAWADERAIAHWLRRCPAGTSVATDFRRIVLLPNRTTRYLLRHAESADIVLIFRQVDPFFSDHDSAEALWHMLEGDAAFRLRRSSAGVRIYARPSVSCLDPEGE